MYAMAISGNTKRKLQMPINITPKHLEFVSFVWRVHVPLCITQSTGLTRNWGITGSLSAIIVIAANAITAKIGLNIPRIPVCSIAILRSLLRSYDLTGAYFTKGLYDKQKDP